MMSSYKNKNTRERKEIQKKEKKGKKPETIQLNKIKPNIKQTKDSYVESTYLRRRNMDKRQDRNGTVNRSSVMVINYK